MAEDWLAAVKVRTDGRWRWWGDVRGFLPRADARLGAALATALATGRHCHRALPAALCVSCGVIVHVRTPLGYGGACPASIQRHAAGHRSPFPGRPAAQFCGECSAFTEPAVGLELSIAVVAPSGPTRQLASWLALCPLCARPPLRSYSLPGGRR